MNKQITAPTLTDQQVVHPYGREELCAGVVQWKNQARIIPTGVGKTHNQRLILNRFKKHPHGRGEDQSPTRQQAACKETPPRAWGRLSQSSPRCTHRGNTPTGVGKTGIMALSDSWLRKHPHGRGEDWPLLREQEHCQETPPRAWGRRQLYQSD